MHLNTFHNALRLRDFCELFRIIWFALRSLSAFTGVFPKRVMPIFEHVNAKDNVLRLVNVSHVYSNDIVLTD